MRSIRLLSLFLILSISLTLGCGEESISRDHIPILKAQLYKLQERVVDRDRAAIDSLMAVEILDEGLSSDSLLSFVYGSQSDFGFAYFGNALIVHTNDKARIDCFIQDSTQSEERPITFTFARYDDDWLLKRFELTPPDMQNDSLEL